MVWITSELHTKHDLTWCEIHHSGVMVYPSKVNIPFVTPSIKHIIEVCHDLIQNCLHEGIRFAYVCTNSAAKSITFILVLNKISPRYINEICVLWPHYCASEKIQNMFFLNVHDSNHFARMAGDKLLTNDTISWSIRSISRDGARNGMNGSWQEAWVDRVGAWW